MRYFFEGENWLTEYASLAPGRLRGDDEKYDIALNLKYKGFTFDGKYIDRGRDFSVGAYPVLNHKTDLNLKDYFRYTL